MPTKEIFTPQKVFVSFDGKNYMESGIELGNAVIVETTEGDEMDEAERLFRQIATSSMTLTFTVKAMSGSNRRRMHGKKAFRLRTYWRCLRHEIHS